MWALIAFIAMAFVILTLIEINERIKAKRPKENCPQENASSEACTDCSLAEACTKKMGDSTAAQ